MDGLHILRTLYSHLFVGGPSLERAGTSRLAAARLGAGFTPHIEVASPEFAQGQRIPIAHSADGSAVSPALCWGAPPEATRSMVLLCEDPDAAFLLPFVHWLLYDLPPDLKFVPAALHGGAPDELGGGHVGRNSRLKSGWAGCAPPKGDNEHHYHFQLFALDRVLAIEPGAGRSRVLEGTGCHVIGFGELVGTYQR